jgi:hypothetical protein
MEFNARWVTCASHPAAGSKDVAAHAGCPCDEPQGGRLERSTGWGEARRELTCVASPPRQQSRSIYTTHYLWAQARHRKLDDQAFDERLRTAVHNVVVYEDKPMIEAQQIEMGTVTDIIALRPVLLEPDVPTIRAQRVLARMIEEEQGEAADEAKKTA